MAVTRAGPVVLEFDDYIRYSEMHPDDAFELLDGVIYRLSPEGDLHLLTRSAVHIQLMQVLDLGRFTPWTEASFSAPGWPDGPKPDIFVSRGPLIVEHRITARPQARDIALVIEVASTSRPKDEKRAQLYAKLEIPEYWLIDLRSAEVVVHSIPVDGVYTRCHVLTRGSRVDSVSVDGLDFDVVFLLQLAAV